MLAKQTDVENCLSTIQPLLSKAVLNAWGKYQKKCFIPKGPGHARARANALWSFIIHEAQRLVGSDPKLHSEITPQTARFTYDSRVQFRFKKLDNDGYTRNYPTQAALSWLDQECDLFPPMQRVEIGYVLNATETEIEDIRVVHQHRDKVAWQYSIMDNSIHIIPIAANEDKEEVSAPKVTVRAKRPVKDAETQNKK